MFRRGQRTFKNRHIVKIIKNTTKFYKIFHQVTPRRAALIWGSREQINFIWSRCKAALVYKHPLAP